jgi:hypothetical protein
MSVITNVILSFSLAEEDYEDDGRMIIRRVNEFFRTTDATENTSGFVIPDGHGWYGGTKVLTRLTFVACFNYLRIGEFVQHLKEVPWREPQKVQLFIDDERDDDDVYKLVDVWA